MAKITDYPKASMRAALQIAEAVDGFAGSCSVELAAEKLGKKVSGAFSSLISSSVKYGLLDNKSGKLTVTPLYKHYRLAYTPDEAMRYLREAILSPRLFRAVYERFKTQRLPIEHFEKMLIREFEVPSDFSSRVAGYFLEGAKQAGLLSAENYLIAFDDDDSELIAEDDSSQANIPSSVRTEVAPLGQDYQVRPSGGGESSEDHWINIRGPGINFSIEIKEEEDLALVEIMLRKIGRRIKANDL